MKSARGYLERFFGNDEFEIIPMIGDASTRRYWRIVKRDSTFVLMDGDPVKNRFEEFVQIDQLLRNLDVYVPAILGCDMENGYMLLEDLGNDTFARLLELGDDEECLYELATEILVKTAKLEKKPEFMKVMDGDAVSDIIEWFVEYYYPYETGKKISAAARKEFLEIVEKLKPMAFKVRSGLSMRDYHVPNLMLMRDKKTAATIDFQDAIWAPLTYDIVSLVEDARREVSTCVQAKMKEMFFESLHGVERTDFDDSFAFVSMFRHMRVLGVFAMHKKVTKKVVYLRFIPHIKKMLYKTLEYSALKEMKGWVLKNIGEFRYKKPVAKAMILAAGRGTRMREMADDLPKPLIEVKSRPLIDYRLDLLKELGIKDVVVNVCYHGDKIKEHVKSMTGFNVVISEEEEALETGGGIKKALPYLGNDPFFTMNSDEIWNDSSHKSVMWQMYDKWDDLEYDILLLVAPLDGAHEKMRDYGDYRVNEKDRLERNVEKVPGCGYDLMFVGVTLVNPKVFEGSPAGKFGYRDLFDEAEKVGRLGYVIIRDEIFHVGTPEDKLYAEENFKV